MRGEGEKQRHDISMSKVSRRHDTMVMMVEEWKWKNGGRKQAFYPFGSYSRAFSSLSHISHDTFPLIAFFPCYKKNSHEDAMRCNCFLFFFYFRIYCGLYVTHLADLLLPSFFLFLSFSPYIPYTHTSMQKAIKRATISWTSSLEQEPLNIMKSCLYPRVYCAPRVSCLLFFFL